MNRTEHPAIQPLKEIAIAVPERTALPNGIPLSVIRAGSQDVVRIDILFHSGRWHQRQKLQSLFTNRMLQEGTRTYSAALLAERLDYYGSWLEPYSAADHACVTVYSLNKYVPETLDVVESLIKEPLFPEERLRTVVEANLSQFRVNTSKVDFLAHRGLLKSLYGEQHPCGDLIIENDYTALTPELLRDFYEQHYHSGNCSVFLSGKVTPAVIDRVEKSFGQPFGRNVSASHTPDFPYSALPDKRVFIERPDALQSAVRMGDTTITRRHPDYLRLRVLMTLFGGYFGSRLMSNIREEKGYTYGISAGISFYPGSGLLSVAAETDNVYVNSLIEEVYVEIDRLHQELVSEEELAVVRNFMLGEMCRNYESPFSLADAWIFIDTAGLDDSYFSRSLHAVNEVTPQELRELACKYLCKERLKEVIAGKKIS